MSPIGPIRSHGPACIFSDTASQNETNDLIDRHFPVNCAGLAIVRAIAGVNLSKTNLEAALREEGSRGGTTGLQRQRTQSVLVTAQIPFACILMIGAGVTL
jgi:hypothetical protein